MVRYRNTYRHPSCVGWWCPSRQIWPSSELIDYSGNNNPGVLVNMDVPTDWIVSQDGYAVTFDGVGDYVNCGDEKEFQFERTDPFSISMWFLTSSSTTQLLISKSENSGNYRGYGISIGSGRITFVLRSVITTSYIQKTTTATFHNGLWHHLVCKSDGSSTAAGCEIWVDGVLQATTTAADTLTSTILTSNSLQISGRGGGAAFPMIGPLDNIALFNTSLVGPDIRELYSPSARIRRSQFIKAAAAPGGFKAFRALCRSRIIGGGEK